MYSITERVGASKTDANGNMTIIGAMNNTKYIEVALEIIPENTKINQLRIEYKKSAKLGDTLYPKLLKTSNNKIYILLQDSSDNPYFTNFKI